MKRGEDCHPGRHRGLDHTGRGFYTGQLNRNEAPGKEEFGKGPAVSAAYYHETADEQLIQEDQAA